MFPEIWNVVPVHNKTEKTFKDKCQCFSPIILLAYLLENALIVDIIELSDLNFLQRGAGDAVLAIVT